MKSFAECLQEARAEAALRENQHTSLAGKPSDAGSTRGSQAGGVSELCPKDEARDTEHDSATLGRRTAVGIFLFCLFAVLAALLLTTGTVSAEEPGPEAIYIEAPNAAEKITEAAPNGGTRQSGIEGDENALIETALIGYAEEYGDVMPECRVTWYTASAVECGKSDGITATGFKVIEGATIGVDPGIIPLLSDVCVEWPDGTREWYVATDTGVTGAAVDIYCEDAGRAVANGVKQARVYWVPPGAIS